MITFRYVAEIEPPAPFVVVSIGHPCDSQWLDQLAARVDSAADRTIIPISIAEALQLEPSRELLMEGLGGHQVRLPAFAVQMRIQGLTAFDLEVASHSAEAIVLLGRDVLNRYRLLLDGPNQKLEIDSP